MCEFDVEGRGDIDVMFSDLSKEKQKEILEAYGIESPEEMNWDVIPVTMVARPEKGEN